VECGRERSSLHIRESRIWLIGSMFDASSSFLRQRRSRHGQRRRKRPSLLVSRGAKAAQEVRMSAPGVKLKYRDRLRDVSLPKKPAHSVTYVTHVYDLQCFLFKHLAPFQAAELRTLRCAATWLENRSSRRSEKWRSRFVWQKLLRGLGCYSETNLRSRREISYGGAPSIEIDADALVSPAAHGSSCSSRNGG
jgi:hypothetical protein